MITSTTTKLLRISTRQRWTARLNFFSTNNASYFERKAAIKQERVQEFVHRLQKNEERKNRRNDSPRDVLKEEFREWWGERKAQEESLDRMARQANKDWKIEVAVVLERLPVVLDDVSDWEKEYDELKAYLAQFGKEYPKELVAQQTRTVYMTDEELLAELPPKFRPSPRETEADKSGKQNSMDRKLKSRIFFLLDAGEGKFRFPASSVKDGESLQDTAKRIINEQVGKDMDLYFPSSSPVAVQVQKEEEEGEFFGTKKFFMKVQHDEGNVKKGLKHGWLDREEVVGAVEEDQKFYHYLL